MYGGGSGHGASRNCRYAGYHAGHFRLFQRGGTKDYGLAERDITAGAIMTREAFENAIIIHSAIGGSTNATIHLLP